MEKYLLKKDWHSKRHGKIICQNSELIKLKSNERGDVNLLDDEQVFLINKKEMELLINGDYIENPTKAKKKKSKKIKEDGGTNDTTDN